MEFSQPTRIISFRHIQRSNATTSASRPSLLPQNRHWEKRLGRRNTVKTTGARHFIFCLFLVQMPTIMMLLCCNGNLDDHWSYCQDPNSSTVVSQKWCWGEKDRRGDLKRFQSLLKAYPSNQASANPLDGCTQVFIEIGSNNDVGMQIRKLFEPQLFQGDPALPIYQRCSAAKLCGSVPSMIVLNMQFIKCRYFGPPETRQPDQICAVGFYPEEIIDEPSLKALEDNYSTCGIKVILFTD